MRYNIASARDALRTLMCLSGASIDEIQAFVTNSIIQNGITRDATKLTARNFMRRFGISSNSININDIHIHGVHYTSNDDSNFTICEFGLRDLQYSLSNDTSLYRFLSEHDIHFDFPNRKLAVGLVNFNISYDNNCFYPDDPVSIISRRVFHDNAISCFLYVRNVRNYLGAVHIRPEIIADIDRLDPRLCLERNWIQKCTAYEISFSSPLTLFENFSFSDDEKPLYEALLDNALRIAGDMCGGELFGYMKPSSVISLDQITKITRISHEK